MKTLKSLDEVKQRTTFKVDFDVEKLIEKASEDLKINYIFPMKDIVIIKLKTEITKGGVLKGKENEESISSETHDKPAIPDILSFLQSENKPYKKDYSRYSYKKPNI